MNLQTNLQDITAIRLELLPDHNLPHGGPGRSPTGTCALTEFEATLSSADDPDNGKKTTTLKIPEATADVSIPQSPLENTYDDRAKMKRVTGPIAFAIDGKPETAWGIDVGPGRRNQARKAVFRFEQPVSVAEGMLLSIYPSQKHGGWNSDDNQTNNIGRFRISVTTSPDAAADPLPRRVRGILDLPADQRTPAQQQELFAYWRTTVADWQPANERIEKLWSEHPAGTSQLVLKEREQRRKTHVLQRGDFLKPQREVTPGFPEFLNPAPNDGAPTRLTLARWLVDRRAPTTARTIVNRVWQSYFGTGLVETSEDLGSQGTAPSHPELLDWLAVDFMDGGWSLKNLHRTIVTSATYQQSSNVTADLHARDPANRLLARGPRIRLEAEALRDTALAASGLLDRRIGGPSVYPPAPEFLFLPPTSYGPKIWNQDDRAGRYRRSLYTFRFRSVPYPALETFDAPNADFACVRRTRSNTPLQALTTLNETLFVECARALALRTVREGGANSEQRLAFAFRQCVARKPSERESGVLLALLDKQIARHGNGKHDPWQLAADDPKNPPALPEGVVPAELAAWTVVARVLLNLDETITKE